MSHDKISYKEMRHDRLVDIASTTASSFSRHRKVYLTILVLILIGAGVVSTVFYNRSSSREEAAVLLSRARTAPAMKDVFERYPDSPAAPLALISAGNIFYREDKTAEAAESYRLFLDKFPRHQLASFARMGVGYCRESDGDWMEAEQSYRRVIDDYPDSSLIPEARVNIGRCLVRLNRIPEALSVYRQVVQEHPQSGYARIAREEMVALVSAEKQKEEKTDQVPEEEESNFTLDAEEVN